MYKKIFAEELLVIEKAIITDILAGYLPQHIDTFEEWKKKAQL